MNMNSNMFKINREDDFLNIVFEDFRMLNYILKDMEYIFYKVKEIRYTFRFRKRLHVYISDSIDEARKILGEMADENFIGAFFDRDIMILDYNLWGRNSKYSFAKALIHEISHAALECYCGPYMPQWISEGFALYYADQMDISIDPNLFCSLLEANDENSKDSSYLIYTVLFELLIEKYGIESIINSLKKNMDWENHHIFGLNNVNNVIFEFVNCNKTLVLK